MTILEKTAYLKGLLEGMDLEENSKETKLFKAIVEAMDDIALSVSDLEDGMDEMNQHVDEIDEDLDLLEQDYYECEDEEFYEMECPACGETICVDEETLGEKELKCPACGAELDESCICDDCECDDCEYGENKD